MPIGFKLIEPGFGGYVPVAPFGFGVEGIALHETLRLITGSANVQDRSNDQVFPLTNNELRVGRSRSANPVRILSTVFDNALSLEEYINFIQTVGIRNTNFFTKLRDEVLLSLLAKRKRRFTESFLYLYRVLELVSVAFPMLYATTHKDFYDVHNFLKSLLSTDKDGDLRILQKAIPHISKGGGLDALSMEFSVAGYDLDYVSALKGQLNAVVRPHVQGFEFEDQGEILFRVPFDSAPSLMVTVRNRMFHMKIAEKNFMLGHLGGSERICEMCVNEMLYWFALTYSELVRALTR
jgi:hypothetical protein